MELDRALSAGGVADEGREDLDDVARDVSRLPATLLLEVMHEAAAAQVDAYIFFNLYSNVWLFFGKLGETRSRLYRSQILQVNTHLKALVEIYIIHFFFSLVCTALRSQSFVLIFFCSC